MGLIAESVFLSNLFRSEPLKHQQLTAILKWGVDSSQARQTQSLSTGYDKANYYFVYEEN